MSNLFFERGLNGCELQLSNTLRRLWFEHVLWTRFFIVSTAFNLPDLSVLQPGFYRIQRLCKGA